MIKVSKYTRIRFLFTTSFLLFRFTFVSRHICYNFYCIKSFENFELIVLDVHNCGFSLQCICVTHIIYKRNYVISFLRNPSFHLRVNLRRNQTFSSQISMSDSSFDSLLCSGNFVEQLFRILSFVSGDERSNRPMSQSENF